MQLLSLYALASIVVRLPTMLLLRTWVLAIASVYHQRALHARGESHCRVTIHLPRVTYADHYRMYNCQAWVNG